MDNGPSREGRNDALSGSDVASGTDQASGGSGSGGSGSRRSGSMGSGSGSSGSGEQKMETSTSEDDSGGTQPAAKKPKLEENIEQALEKIAIAQTKMNTFINEYNSLIDMNRTLKHEQELLSKLLEKSEMRPEENVVSVSNDGYPSSSNSLDDLIAIKERHVKRLASSATNTSSSGSGEDPSDQPKTSSSEENKEKVDEEDEDERKPAAAAPTDRTTQISSPNIADTISSINAESIDSDSILLQLVLMIVKVLFQLQQQQKKITHLVRDHLAHHDRIERERKQDSSDSSS